MVLPDILNWRRLNDRLTTSGQPDETQLAQLQAMGVTHVVNLGPRTDKGALADEAGTVAELGMEYIHIPVDFEKPTDQDFDAFCKAIEAHPTARMHVHCIYNARVSAFFYRYAKTGGEISEVEAFANMDSIWRPGHDWAGFIDQPTAAGQPNRYAGEDY